MTSMERIAGAQQRSNAAEMTIDLTCLELSVPGLDPIPFELPEDRRASLMEGVDQLDFMLRSMDAVQRWEHLDLSVRHWAHRGTLTRDVSLFG